MGWLSSRQRHLCCMCHYAHGPRFALHHQVYAHMKLSELAQLSTRCILVSHCDMVAAAILQVKQVAVALGLSVTGDKAAQHALIGQIMKTRSKQQN